MDPNHIVMHRGMKGYSLMELLGSMGIILTLSALSFPAAQTGLEANRLHADTRRIIAQCQNARFLAISRNVSHRVRLNGSTVELQRRSGAFYTTIESFPLSAGNSVATPWASDPVFSPRGTASPPSTLTLRSPRGMTRSVSVSVLGRMTEQ